MDKRRIRDSIRFCGAILLIVMYIPHLLIYLASKDVNGSINKDIASTGTDTLKLKGIFALLYLLHNERYFRCLFYHRIGPALSMLISWIRPGDRYFTISKTCVIGAGVKIAHPYATIINADNIGENFLIRNNTTIGFGNGGRPKIGNNVTLGANVIIIGNVHIGNNVSIGAGAVVVKDIPDNTVAVGNPAKVVKLKK